MKLKIALLSLLLASAASPAALAQENHRRDRDGAPLERPERGERPQRSEAPPAPRPPEAQPAPQAPVAREPSGDRGEGRGPRFDRRERDGAPPRPMVDRDPGQGLSPADRADREDRDELRQFRRFNGGDRRPETAQPGAERWDGGGRRPDGPDRRGDNNDRRWDGRDGRGDNNNDRRWDRDGRRDGGDRRGDSSDRRWDGRDGRGDNDRRWDRGDHRPPPNTPRWDSRRYPRVYNSRNRFRGFIWTPPVGFYARSWAFGDFLPRGWYAPDYRIMDWWLYDLPMPPPGYDWVRVGYDALLVDNFTGRVVQVVRLVFW